MRLRHICHFFLTEASVSMGILNSAFCEIHFPLMSYMMAASGRPDALADSCNFTLVLGVETVLFTWEMSKLQSYSVFFQV